MTKQFVKRSQFQFITLAPGVAQTLDVQGDEVYITVDHASTASILFATARELEFQKFLTANSITANNAFTEIYMTNANKRVPIGTTVDAASAAIGYNIDPNFSLYGYKEKISLRIHPSSASGAANVRILIETVHYVPADMIAA
ncbi:hypothetical protein [Spirosoma aerolatum]|uniref:hypothetical protein n=1 Tax=Spirosoma aerolatum TaxID=1211326 RepID=UPI0009ADFA1C|nr:hypothetical protein [Spirosoma aerolatum]